MYSDGLQDNLIYSQSRQQKNDRFRCFSTWIQIFPSGYLLLSLPLCSFPYFSQKCQSQSIIKHLSHPYCLLCLLLWLMVLFSVKCCLLTIIYLAKYIWNLNCIIFYILTKRKSRQIPSCKVNSFTLLVRNLILFLEVILEVCWLVCFFPDTWWGYRINRSAIFRDSWMVNLLHLPSLFHYHNPAARFLAHQG